MTNVTGSTNQANVPIGFSKDLIQAIRYDCIIQKTVTQDKWNKSMGQTIFKNRGINWTKQFKYPNTVLTPNAYVTTSEPLFIDTFEVSALVLEDFSKPFIPDEVLADNLKAMGYALARSIDTTLSNLFQSFSQQVTGTAYNVPIIYPNLATAAQLLQVGGVKPDSEAVFTVISSEQAASFKSSQVFTDSAYAGQDGINNFKKAMLTQNAVAGSTLLQSLLLRAPAGGGHDNAMYSKDAIRMAFANEPEYFEWYYGFDLGMLKGYKQAWGYTRSYRTVETAGSSSLTDAWAAFLPGL